MYTLVALTALSVQLFIPASDACFAAGVCGGGCAPPPPAPVCVSSGCGPGYGCGQYGCHRLRARVASSKTLKIDKSLEGMVRKESCHRLSTTVNDLNKLAQFRPMKRRTIVRKRRTRSSWLAALNAICQTVVYRSAPLLHTPRLPCRYTFPVLPPT